AEANLAHHVADECIDAARRNELTAADRAEHDVRVDRGSVVETGVAGADVLEDRRDLRRRLEVRAELSAVDHRSFLHRRAYSGKRFINCCCMSLRALNR